jgi:hypothetical protein
MDIPMKLFLKWTVKYRRIRLQWGALPRIPWIKEAVAQRRNGIGIISIIVVVIRVIG